MAHFLFISKRHLVLEDLSLRIVCLLLPKNLQNFLVSNFFSVQINLQYIILDQSLHGGNYILYYYLFSFKLWMQGLDILYLGLLSIVDKQVRCYVIFKNYDNNLYISSSYRDFAIAHFFTLNMLSILDLSILKLFCCSIFSTVNPLSPH